MDLKEQLKVKGLNMSEKYLNMMLTDVLELGDLLVKSTETPFDDAGLNALKLFEGEVRKFIDKVDGEEG
jgi:hypothetical protein